MTLIVQELRDAPVEAGASEERANAAAKAVTSAEAAATKDDLRLAVADLRKEMAELKADLMRAIWMQAGVIIGALSLVFATLIKVL